MHASTLIRGVVVTAMFLSITLSARAVQPLAPTPIGPGSSSTPGNDYISLSNFTVSFSLSDTSAINADVQIYHVNGNQRTYDTGYQSFTNLGTNWMTVPASAITTSGDEYYWTATSKNAQGQTATSAKSYFYGNLVPAIPTVNSPGYLFTGSSVTVGQSLTFSVTLPTSPVAVTAFSFTVIDTTTGATAFRSGTVNGSSYDVPASYFTNGHAYSWSAVSLAAGQQSAASNSYYFTASISQQLTPQTVSIQPTGVSTTAGQSVSFSATGSSTGYNWSVAPSGPSGISGSGSSQQILFPVSGNYTVSVSAPQSGNYAASTAALATVIVTAAPTLTPQNLTLNPTNATITAGQTVNFTASGSSTGYTWTAPPGSGVSGNGATQLLSFSNAGSYQVSVSAPSHNGYAAAGPVNAIVTVNQTTKPVITEIDAPIRYGYVTGTNFDQQITILVQNIPLNPLITIYYLGSNGTMTSTTRKGSAISQLGGKLSFQLWTTTISDQTNWSLTVADADNLSSVSERFGFKVTGFGVQTGTATLSIGTHVFSLLVYSNGGATDGLGDENSTSAWVDDSDISVDLINDYIHDPDYVSGSFLYNYINKATFALTTPSDPNGFPTGEKWQCTEFVRRAFYTMFQLALPTGNASTYFAQAPALNGGQTVSAIVNGTSSNLQAGDILCYGGGAGHVALVLGAPVAGSPGYQVSVNGLSRLANALVYVAQEHVRNIDGDDKFVVPLWIDPNSKMIWVGSSHVFVDPGAHPCQGWLRAKAAGKGGSGGSDTSALAQLTSGPVFDSQPGGVTVNSGDTTTLAAVAEGTGTITYQWFRDGVAIPGATTQVYSPAIIGTSDEGSYTVVASNDYGVTVSQPAAVTVHQGSSPINLSVRGFAGQGSQSLFAGFSIKGTGQKRVLVRGVGPALASFSVSNPLPLPILTLFDSNSVAIASDAGWSSPSTAGPSLAPASISAASTALFNQVYAFALPVGSADSAMLATVPAALYSAQVSGLSGTSGVALIELYDDDGTGPTSQLSNISARGLVGDQSLAAGFVVAKYIRDDRHPGRWAGTRELWHSQLLAAPHTHPV